MDKPPPPQTICDAMEKSIAAQGHEHYVMRLYIAGPTPQSTRAVVNIRKLCEKHLKGRYDLEVLDLLQSPATAAEDQIIAAPTLAKILPAPMRRFIGDLSETERLLTGLGLPLEASAAPVS